MVAGTTIYASAHGVASHERFSAPHRPGGLLRIHPASYLDAFRALSDAHGGDLGDRAPFGKGSYEIAKLSAGLAIAAIDTVVAEHAANAFSLSRPPGHHCLRDRPMGFCLLANMPIAIEARARSTASAASR